MNRLICGALVLIGLPLSVSVQKTHPPYVGQDARAIKALAPEEVQAYLEGQGMGLAKAAELNHYPGPRHVLELSEKLQLSTQQISETQAVYDKMHAEAVHLGKEIVESEKKLDELFASGAIDEPQLAALVSEIARLQGELRIIHLRAHWSMKKLLSGSQIAEYDKLRGHGQSSDRHQQHHH
jgi:Spy/CpxP family protein refolding chaperone